MYIYMPARPDRLSHSPMASSTRNVALVEQVAATTTQLPQGFVHPRHNEPPLAASCEVQIPIIDLSGLRDQRRPRTVSEIRQACSQWGIFFAFNSRLSPALFAKMQEELQTFLALPVEERAPAGIVDSFHKQGYGSGHVQAGGPGAIDWRDFLILATYPESQRDYNVWPRSSTFRKLIHDWCEQSKLFSEELLDCFSESLGMSSSYIREKLGELHQMIIFNVYPPCPQPDLTIGASEHTDPGAVSILWQSSDVDGLQVLKDGAWVTVTQPPGACIVIVGDLVEMISNGTYRSVKHRAITNSSQRRISLVVFYNVDHETVVAPAPQLVDEHHPPVFKPSRFLDHISRYY